MGLEIDRDHFEDADYAAFDGKVRRGLAALQQLLERPGFGTGPASIGAEVEFSLVDEACAPCLISRKVMNAALEPRLAFELDRFNLEYNADPRALAAGCFDTLGAELDAAMGKVDAIARNHGGRVALVGILPTLREEDLQASAMTQTPRYRALSAGLKRLRSAAFHIDIEGDERLELDCDDVTMEGANTSLQLHLRVPPGEFADIFNAAQLATAPVLAAGANSPIFLSRLLWRETRVALFGRAVDYRMEGHGWRPARVSFGHGWVRHGAFELFSESAMLHSPILPMTSDEDPLAVVAAGGVPDLGELKLHHGTVWSWNRAVYDNADGGHLRIELRALPTGPTVTDMMASAAFLIGLIFGLRENIQELIAAIPFRLVHDNFYRAASDGLDSILLWPAPQSPSPDAHRASDLVSRLIPIAQSGLEANGLTAAEAKRWLAIIEARIEAGITGSQWQRNALQRLEGRRSRRLALPEMFARYLDNVERSLPVHEWPIAG